MGNLYFCDELLRVEALEKPQKYGVLAPKPLGQLAVVGESLRVQSGLGWQATADAS